MTIYLVEGDTKPILSMTIKDSTGTAVDITGATVTFHFFNLDTGTQTNAADDDCVLLVPADGTCTYTWNATDLDTPGDYLGEVKVVFADTTIQTVYGTMEIIVRAALG